MTFYPSTSASFGRKFITDLIQLIGLHVQSSTSDPTDELNLGGPK